MPSFQSTSSTTGGQPGDEAKCMFSFLWRRDTNEEEETLTTLGFNPPEYSNSLHRRFFVCSDQHEAKIKPEKSAAKTGVT